MVVVERLSARDLEDVKVFLGRLLAESECASRETTPVPFLNALFLHLDDLAAECSSKSPFGPKVVRNLVRTLVSQIKITLRD